MPFDGPLTEEQRRFAEQNHNLVYKFLHQHGLSIDEYYDIVIFGFLLAVQRYLTDVSLTPYAFSTVAWSAMESALRNHRRTAQRRLRLHTKSGRHGRYRICRPELPSESEWMSQLETTLLLHTLSAMVSAQQMQVLQLRAQGVSVRAIATRLKTNIQQVNELLEDVRNILHKLSDEC